MTPTKHGELKRDEIFMQYYVGHDHADIFIGKYIGRSNVPYASITCKIIQHFHCLRSPCNICCKEQHHEISNRGLLAGEDSEHFAVGDIGCWNVELFRLDHEEVLAILSEEI